MADSETLVATETSSMEEGTNGNEEQSMPVAQKPSEVSDSDSESESDSDSEDEAQTKAQIEALEAELYNNPSDYDSNVQYIKMLRKQGDLEKLRQAREAMSSLFPLSPEMWREWAKDETTVSSGVEALPKVEKLYERGISEYLSVDLWCDYLDFVQEYDPSVRECSAAGISKTRNLFERAITAAGLHVAEGHRIWELYRDFEQAIYFSISENDSGAREKQTQHIRRLFHRQLSIPLADLKSTYEAYTAWEADHESTNDVNNVVSAYQKALDMFSDRAHLEEKISKKNADSEKLQEFMTYLKFEHSSGDPARIQVLYERAITEFPISTDLWHDYTQYLDRTFKTARIVRDAYFRATRNCPWVGDLWVRYLLSLERSRSPEEELSNVFEKSLLCTFPSFDEYLNIFLTRVDGLRRRLSASTTVEDGMEYAVLRDIFQRASEYLSSNLNNTYSLLGMHSYWARLELKFGKDLKAAREVWESFLKISGSMLEAWQTYIAWEMEMGNINEARSLYKRCYSKRFPGTGSEDIIHAWERFEREYGSLEDFDIAVQKDFLRITRENETLFLWQLRGLMSNDPWNERLIKTVEREDINGDPRELGSGLNELVSIFRGVRRRILEVARKAEPPDYDQGLMLMTPVAPRLQELQLYRLQQESKNIGQATANERENSSKKSAREKRKPTSNSIEEQAPAKRHKNTTQNVITTIEKDKRQSPEAKESAQSDENKAERGSNQEIKDKSSNKPVQFDDKCTAFVSNINLQASASDLRNFFSDVGGVVDVRILKDKFTKKSRGLAYVEFSDDAHLAAAVGKNKQNFLGKRLSILKSDPQGRNKGVAGRSTRPEHSDAAKQTNKMDSDEEVPKGRRESQPQSPSSKADVQLKGKNTFAVPRNVKPLGWTKSKGAKKHEEEEEPPKSNDEFRKMFLKK